MIRATRIQGLRHHPSNVTNQGDGVYTHLFRFVVLALILGSLLFLGTYYSGLFWGLIVVAISLLASFAKEKSDPEESLAPRLFFVGIWWFAALTFFTWLLGKFFSWLGSPEFSCGGPCGSKVVEEDTQLIEAGENFNSIAEINLIVIVLGCALLLKKWWTIRQLQISEGRIGKPPAVIDEVLYGKRIVMRLLQQEGVQVDIDEGQDD